MVPFVDWSFSASARPCMPGRLMSSRKRSGRAMSSWARADSASPTVVTWCPAVLSVALTNLQMRGSSSTARICAMRLSRRERRLLARQPLPFLPSDHADHIENDLARDAEDQPQHQEDADLIPQTRTRV